jgi:hypothetical protein
MSHFVGKIMLSEGWSSADEQSQIEDESQTPFSSLFQLFVVGAESP